MLEEQIALRALALRVPMWDSAGCEPVVSGGTSPTHALIPLNRWNPDEISTECGE